MLPDGGWVEGRVAGLQPGDELEGEIYSAEVSGRWTVRAADDGRFRTSAPRPGLPFVLVIRRPDGSFFLRAVEALAVGQDLDLGSVAFDHGVVLRGRVLDGEGRGVANARVRLTERWVRREARAGDDGAFQFDHVPARPLWVRVDAKGLPPAFRVLDPRPSGRREVRLTEGGTFELRTLDALGAPLEKGTLSIAWDVSSPLDADLDDLRDLFWLTPGGTTRLPREAGTYRFAVSDETHEHEARGRVEIRDGETTVVEVRLAPAGR